jgi:DNA modification methylase
MLGNYRIIVGDVLEGLRTLPEKSVQTCVSSPPYWGLRDYGVEGQIGLEATPDLFVRKIVAVYREVRRVLTDDGTIWVNLGDSYAGSWGAQSRGDFTPGTLEGASTKETMLSARQIKAHPKGTHTGNLKNTPGLKQKDLVGIPWMVAFALRADGWYLRSDIIWHKPNPMPESVTDRPTKAHEYIFLLSKSERYFYDAEAILEPCSPNTHMRVLQNVAAQIGSERAHAGGKTNGNMKAVVRDTRKLAEAGSGTKNNDSFAASVVLPVHQRNKRSVWTVPTQSFKEAHFATYPEKLIEPCILAGSRPGDTVLDPFSGSGTTGAVACRHGRNYLGCELNPEYAAMSERRIGKALRPGTFADQREVGHAPLFKPV